MRKQPTEAECLVWHIVRDRRVHGLKFRRQAVIAGFIADFYSAELQLVLELDGSLHDHPEIHAYDLAGDEALTRMGHEIIRIRNDMASAATIESIVQARLGT